jgi:hypothetical protein
MESERRGRVNPRDLTIAKSFNIRLFATLA